MATPARKLFLYLAPVTASNDLGFHRPWKPVAHWALCVGGICFELTRLPQPSATGATHGSSVVTLAEWRSVRDRDGRQYKGSAVGHHCTRWSDREIEECAHAIWNTLFRGQYSILSSQHCQVFFEVLAECIAEEPGAGSLIEKIAWQILSSRALDPQRLHGTPAGTPNPFGLGTDILPIPIHLLARGAAKLFYEAVTLFSSMPSRKARDAFVSLWRANGAVSDSPLF